MATREVWEKCNIPVRTKLCHKVHKKVRGQWYGVRVDKMPDHPKRKPKK